MLCKREGKGDEAIRFSYVPLFISLAAVVRGLWGIRPAEATNRTYGVTGALTGIDNLNSTPLDGSDLIGAPYTVTHPFEDSVASSRVDFGLCRCNRSAETFSMTLAVGN